MSNLSGYLKQALWIPQRLILSEVAFSITGGCPIINTNLFKNPTEMVVPNLSPIQPAYSQPYGGIQHHWTAVR